MVRFLSTIAFSVLFPSIVLAAAGTFPRQPDSAGVDNLVARKSCEGKGQSYGYPALRIFLFALISSAVR